MLELKIMIFASEYTSFTASEAIGCRDGHHENYCRAHQ